jgi:hypothetical protein
LRELPVENLLVRCGWCNVGAVVLGSWEGLPALAGLGRLLSLGAGAT